MPTPLSFGLVGAGWIGAVHADTLARRLPNARLTAVADPQPDAAKRLSARFAHFVEAKGKVEPGKYRAFGYTPPGHLLRDARLAWRDIRMRFGSPRVRSSPRNTTIGFES